MCIGKIIKKKQKRKVCDEFRNQRLKQTEEAYENEREILCDVHRIKLWQQTEQKHKREKRK